MISLQNPGADVFVPDGIPTAEAARRITHLAIGAHQDDLEFMAYHGIVTCYDRPGWSFGGVTCTDGAGSARQGLYAEKTDEEMRVIRGEEQRAAARLGRYGLMVQLGHSTETLKTASANPLTPDLMALFSAVSPGWSTRTIPLTSTRPIFTSLPPSSRLCAAFRRKGVPCVCTAAKSGGAWTGWRTPRRWFTMSAPDRNWLPL